MSIELPAVIGAFDVLSVEIAAVEGHAAVRTGVAQGEGAARAVAPDYEGNFEQHGLVKLIAMQTISGKGAIPEASEHE